MLDAIFSLQRKYCGHVLSIIASVVRLCGTHDRISGRKLWRMAISSSLRMLTVSGTRLTRLTIESVTICMREDTPSSRHDCAPAVSIYHVGLMHTAMAGNNGHNITQCTRQRR